MIIPAPAKINIGLYVTSRRNDGYHNIETIFYPVPLFDFIEVLPSQSFSLTEYGISSGCPVKENICFKVWELLAKDYGISPVEIHLLKNIPVMSGLGGGSSDAVAVLKALNTIFELGFSKEVFFRYALQLGSDCPFFIQASPAYAKSRGEILQSVKPVLQGDTLIIFKPEFGISTREAFSQVIVETHGQLYEKFMKPPSTWNASIKNMFEPMFLEKHPDMVDVIKSFYNSGAYYVSMSGSGSAFYALFKNSEIAIPELPDGFYCRKLKI